MATKPPDPSSATIVPITPVGAAASGDANQLAGLLQFEAEIRRQQSVPELQYLVANELRRLLPYDQMFILQKARIGDRFHVHCASSIATVDRNAPLIQALEKMLAGMEKDHDLNTACDFAVDAMSDDPALAEYPYKICRLQPLKDSEGNGFAALLIVGERALREDEIFRLNRVAETIEHSWRALTGDKPVRKIARLGRKEKIGLGIIVAVAALFPVQMTALAPVEVVPARPFMVAAPFSGVIARIHVQPNAEVKEGALLISFDDVKLGNELKLAEEKLSVAQARVERSASSAFAGEDESRDVAMLRAEYDLAKADYEFSSDVMARSQITAPRDGMVIYGDRRDWEGRAVNIGDPILQVAKSDDISLRVDLPAAEQMRLEKGSAVKVWLDAQPLWAIDGTIENASYQARMTPEGVLAFAVNAKLSTEKPRIGSRGTAKLYGEWVPLSYSVLKRPIASFRQFIGF